VDVFHCEANNTFDLEVDKGNWNNYILPDRINYEGIKGLKSGNSALFLYENSYIQLKKPDKAW